MGAVRVEPDLVGREGDGLIGGFERLGEIMGQDKMVSEPTDRFDAALQGTLPLGIAGSVATSSLRIATLSRKAASASLQPPVRIERVAEIVLGRRPVERHALAGPFLQRRAIGGDRLLQPRRAALALAEGSRAHCRDCSGSWPSRAARARGCVPPAPRDRRRPPPPAAPCRSRARRALVSALPRLFCVVAQSSGTRSRVRSFSAAR